MYFWCTETQWCCRSDRGGTHRTQLTPDPTIWQESITPGVCDMWLPCYAMSLDRYILADYYQWLINSCNKLSSVGNHHRNPSLQKDPHVEVCIIRFLHIPLPLRHPRKVGSQPGIKKIIIIIIIMIGFIQRFLSTEVLKVLYIVGGKSPHSPSMCSTHLGDALQAFLCQTTSAIRWRADEWYMPIRNDRDDQMAMMEWGQVGNWAMTLTISAMGSLMTT